MKLPRISGIELVKILSKFGYKFVRQHGSHAILRNDLNKGTTVPLHKELDRGTLLAILDQRNINREEFFKALGKRK